MTRFKFKFFVTLVAIISAFCLVFGLAACGKDKGNGSGNGNGDGGETDNKTYTVTYDDGVTGEDITVPVDSNKYKKGDTVTVKDGIQRDDYEFVCWLYDSVVLEPGQTFTMPARNVTLTAKWNAVIVTKYTVTYDLNGGEGTAPTQSDTKEGGTFTLADTPVKSGYKFLGWLTDNADDANPLYAASATYTMPAKNVTLTAQWAEYHTVTYDLGTYTDYDGDPITEADHVVGDTFTVKAAPSRDGFNFLGWFDGVDFYDANDTYTMPDANVTLVAQWEDANADKFSVTYALDDGDWADAADAPASNLEYAEGSPVKLPKAPVKDGYRFLGWLTDDADDTNPLYAAEAIYTMPGKAVVLTAKWAQLYALTLNLDGGSWNDGDEPAAATYAENDPVTLPAAVPVNAGHKFLGWKTESGDTVYAAGSSFTMPGHAVTLTAWWGTYHTVTFAWGAHGEGEGTLPTEDNHAKDDTFTLPAGPFHSIDYVFAGWNDGTDTYKPGATYTMPDDDVILTAQWTSTPVMGVGYSNRVTVDIGNGEDNATVIKLDGLAAGDYEITLAGNLQVKQTYATITVLVGDTPVNTAGDHTEQSGNISITDETYIRIYANASLTDVTVSLKQILILREDVPATVTIPGSGDNKSIEYLLGISAFGKYVITLEGGDGVTIEYTYGDPITAGEPFEADPGLSIVFKGNGGTSFTATLSAYTGGGGGGDDVTKYTLGLDTPTSITLKFEHDTDLDSDMVRAYITLDNVPAGNKYVITFSDSYEYIGLEIWGGGYYLCDTSGMLDGASGTFELYDGITELVIQGMYFTDITVNVTLTEYVPWSGVLEVGIPLTNVPVGLYAEPTVVTLGTLKPDTNYTLTLSGGIWDTYVVGLGAAPDEDKDTQIYYSGSLVFNSDNVNQIYLYVFFGSPEPVTLTLTEGGSTEPEPDPELDELYLYTDNEVTIPTTNDQWVEYQIYLPAGVYTFTISDTEQRITVAETSGKLSSFLIGENDHGYTGNSVSFSVVQPGTYIFMFSDTQYVGGMTITVRIDDGDDSRVPLLGIGEENKATGVSVFGDKLIKLNNVSEGNYKLTITISGVDDANLSVILADSEVVATNNGDGTYTAILTLYGEAYIGIHSNDGHTLTLLLEEYDGELPVRIQFDANPTGDFSIVERDIYLTAGEYRITLSGDYAAHFFVRDDADEGLGTLVEVGAITGTFYVSSSGYYDLRFVDWEFDGHGCSVLIEKIG